MAGQQTTRPAYLDTNQFVGSQHAKALDPSLALGNTECRGLRRARHATARLSSLSLATVNAHLQVGAFKRPLPIAPAQVAEFALQMLNISMQVAPAGLDVPPKCETAFGAVPVLLVDRCQALDALAAQADRHAGQNGRLMQASLMLDQDLRTVEEAWEIKRRVVWQQLRETETIAAELLSMHLSRSLLIARVERDRYLQPGRAAPLNSSEHFQSLRQAIDRIAGARQAIDLDDIRQEERVVTAVTMAATVAGVVAMLGSGRSFDKAGWDLIHRASELSTESARHTAEAQARFLTVLTTEAVKHPVLLILDHLALQHQDPPAVARAVDEALTGAELAIGNLRATAANTSTVPDQRRPQDVTMTGLAKRLSGSEPVSVWKIPFFVEAALLELPPTAALETRRMMELAAQLRGGEAVGQSLSLFGVNSAAMLAPAAGPIGVGLALAWALFNLGSSIKEYRQLSDLFAATLDPSTLLRGVEHEEATKLMIALDIFGLFVW